jgi:CRISPR-associated protein Csh1
LFILKGELTDPTKKNQKEEIANRIADIEQKLLKVKTLEDKEYIIFYLDLPLELYHQTHKKYLDDNLFNTTSYNINSDKNNIIYGTSNFMNGFSAKKPFIIHQTASFDISGRISNIDAKLLNDLNNMFLNKTLPNPLPLFIYKEEVQSRLISIFRDSGFRFGYKEILEKFFENYTDEIENYYLLFWINSQKGPLFFDFDFVSKFEYKLPNPIAILNLFDIRLKEEKGYKHYPLIKNIFELEQQILRPFIQNKYKYLNIDYFGDLNKDDYAKLDLTFSSYCKYRKAIYDYIYKSQRNMIDGHIFDEIVFNSIKDDIKNNNAYGIKEKLNIWYSLFGYFNKNNNNQINMVNKLKEYQDFVAAIITDEPLTDITDEKFAFAAGQVIEYILNKSKSADNSYNLLEPYLQQAKCTEFKRAIANDFGRYKHGNFSKNFEKVAAFVLSYETTANLKHLLPQILSGVFAKNQLFSANTSK